MNWSERNRHRHRNGAFLEAVNVVRDELKKMRGSSSSHHPSDFEEGARQLGNAIFDRLMVMVETESRLWEVAASEGQVLSPKGAPSFPPTQRTEAGSAPGVAPDALGAQLFDTHHAPQRSGDGNVLPPSGSESSGGGTRLSTQEEVPL